MDRLNRVQKNGVKKSGLTRESTINRIVDSFRGFKKSSVSIANSIRKIGVKLLATQHANTKNRVQNQKIVRQIT